MRCDSSEAAHVQPAWSLCCGDPGIKGEKRGCGLRFSGDKGPEAQPAIVVTLDLASAKPGRYFLETRLEEQGILGYYPVVSDCGGFAVETATRSPSIVLATFVVASRSAGGH